MMMNYERGTVWWVELPLNLDSHVQGGARPCVIVSNPLERSGVVTVCPLSTKIDEIKTHPKVNVRKEGQVLIEQITTVDISKISNYVGVLSENELADVDTALLAYLTSDIVDCGTDNLAISRRLHSVEKLLHKIIQILEFLVWKEKRE